MFRYFCFSSTDSSSWCTTAFRLLFLTLWTLKTRASAEVAHVRVAKKSWTPLQLVGPEPCKTASYRDLLRPPPPYSQLLYVFSSVKIIIKHLLTLAINRTHFCKQKLKWKIAPSHFWPASCTKSLSKAAVRKVGFGRIHTGFTRCHALLDHQNKLLLSSVCYWENFALFQLRLLVLLKKPPEK